MPGGGGERTPRRYASEISIIIGPEEDIPAPDVYTDSQVMAWIMDTFSMTRGTTALGVVTGKPLCIGGSLGRKEATARGARVVIREPCQAKEIPLRGEAVADPGIRNAGSLVSQLHHQHAAKE